MTEPWASPDSVAERVSGPTINTREEPWIGNFPGLGSIAVHADGTFDVQVQSADDEEIQLREDALRHGWAELLSSVRRGHSHASGMTWGHPEANRCLLLLGDIRETTQLYGPLLDRDLAVIADRPAPLSWDGDKLVAQPSVRPVVTSRSRAGKLGLEWTQLRGDTDAGRVDMPRLHEPVPVGGVLMAHARRPGEDVFTPSTGHEKVEVAAGLILRGVLDPDFVVEEAADEDDELPDLVGQRHRRNLAIAALPMARLRLEAETALADFESAAAWIDEVLLS